MNAKIAAHVGINPYQTLATTHTRGITMDNNHILIIEYIEHDRRCAELSIENYRAEIKEGSVLFEYKMSKSVERFDGGTTLGRKVAIDYMENNFGYVRTKMRLWTAKIKLSAKKRLWTQNEALDQKISSGPENEALDRKNVALDRKN